MVRVCTIKYVNGKDNNGLFLEIEDIDAGSVVLKQVDGYLCKKYTLQTVKGKNAERLQMLLQSCMRLRIYLSWMREDTDLLS